MRITRKQRSNLSRFFFELSGFTYLTLVIGQFVSKLKVNLFLLLIGFTISLLFAVLGLIFEK